MIDRPIKKILYFPSLLVVCLSLDWVAIVRPAEVEQHYALLFPFVYYSVMVTTIVVAIGQAESLFRRRMLLEKTRLLPVFAAVFIMALVAPFKELEMAQDFLLLLTQRIETVKLVQQKKLQESGFLCGDRSRWILPEELNKVSQTGYVAATYGDHYAYDDPDELQVVFYRQKRGTPVKKQFFVYAIRDSLYMKYWPKNLVNVRLIKNWFWVYEPFS